MSASTDELLMLLGGHDPQVVGDLAGELIEADHLLGVGPEAGILAEEEQQVLAQPGEVLDLLEHVFQARRDTVPNRGGRGARPRPRCGGWPAGCAARGRRRR